MKAVSAYVAIVLTGIHIEFSGTANELVHPESAIVVSAGHSSGAHMFSKIKN